MSGDLTRVPVRTGRFVASEALAEAIRATDFSDCAATVIGFGNVGKQYVRALHCLGVRRIRVCARSAKTLEELRGIGGVDAIDGGFQRLECRPEPGELGIVGTPIESLAPAAERLAILGFRRLLIEKPVSLWSEEIAQLAGTLDEHNVEARCAYNRLAYPSFHEVAARASEDGGITSCTYAFTEMIRSDWTERFPAEELARWGIANSLHVIGMAHGLVGLPAEWNSHRSGALSWHPSGSVFVGSGVSAQGIPFSYHADWESKGRWSVEVHTQVSSYRLCPLEGVQRKTDALGDWQDLPVAVFAPESKPGFAEQVAYNLGPMRDRGVVSPSLLEVAELTRYAEQIFGYPPTRGTSFSLSTNEGH